MDHRRRTLTILLFAAVLHAASPFGWPGFFHKTHEEKVESPPNNKPIPVDSHKLREYTGPIFIIREREPRTENISNGYEGFVTTGGINLSQTSSLTKNNMDESQVRNDDESNSSDAEGSSHFGVIVNSDTIGKLQLSDSWHINVTLSTLLKAATSRMPWLLVLQRKKIKEIFVDLGNQQKQPEKETVAKSLFAERNSQPKISGQPQRRVFQFIRQRRNVPIQSDPTTLLSVNENNHGKEKKATTPVIPDGKRNIVVFPVKAEDKVDTPPCPTSSANVDVTQVKFTQPLLATTETDNTPFSFSPTGTIHNYKPFVFPTEVTDKEVISAKPYATSTDHIQVNYHSSHLASPRNQPLNSLPSPNETTNKDNSSTPIKSTDIVETTTNIYSPDINATGTDNYLAPFPLPISYSERVPEVDHRSTKVVQETTNYNQSLLPMTVSNKQLNTPQSVSAITSVVFNQQQPSPSKPTETTTNRYSGPCSLPIKNSGIVNFKDVDNDIVIPMVQPERLVSILCEYVDNEYRQMNTDEELPKPEAMTYVTETYGTIG